MEQERKRESSYDYNSEFPTRLRALMENKNGISPLGRSVSQTELSKAIGVTRQAVSTYALGTSAPDIIKFRAISDFFHVSSDWLLGLTDVATQDADVRLICDYTGLDEHSVDFLHTLIADKNEDGVYPAGFTDEMYNPRRLLNDILCNDYGEPFISMVDFCDGINELYAENDNTDLAVIEVSETLDLTNGRVVRKLSHSDMARLKIEYAKSTFLRFIDTLVHGEEAFIDQTKLSRFMEQDESK